MIKLDQMPAARDAATKAIIESSALRKLVVAGPGTGKTFLFKNALETCNRKGLALTFIRNLVADLKQALYDVADVFTFHGFCKHQLCRHAVEGLQENWDYYPHLLKLLTDDLQILGRNDIDLKEVERCLHDLDNKDDVITDILALGSYYNSVSHTDLVYRAFRHFEHQTDKVPSYPLVVVDEYQDFSRLETGFIDLLVEKSPVLIAGDDDQALYAFKNASARYIRALAKDPRYERFELPYCSRCTQVVVSAVNDALKYAARNTKLVGRIEKDFQCYLPDKLGDSEAYPKIIHAHCTVERKNAPYTGRYICGEIKKISKANIQESHEGEYPTVLVIGPTPFLELAYKEISREYPQAELKKSPKLDVEPLDAYKRLARDAGSYLGWRILVYCRPFEGADKTLSRILSCKDDLSALMPDEYRDCHLRLASHVRCLMDDGTLTPDEERLLCSETGLTIADIRNKLQLDILDEDEDSAAKTDGDTNYPSIICTSLVGAKGLSGGHVFIVGCNDGHFPHDSGNITDEEICCFLVGLSRTRKLCHLVSCGRLGNARLSISSFIRWIEQHVERKRIDASYIKSI